MPAISFKGVTRDFASLRALDDLSFDVPQGSIFGFLGPNGAGKTTAIHLMLGLLEPTAGQVEILGLDPAEHSDDVRSVTGALLEDDGLYEQMSALDNLEFFGRIWRMSESDRITRSQEILTHMGLWERRSDKVASWSRGMRRKLGLARCLLHHPRLIVLDEPTAGLDVPSASAVRGDLEALVEREEATVFLTTHNMAEADRLCDTVAVIHRGGLLAVGSPDELRARRGTSRVEIVGRNLPANVGVMLKAFPWAQVIRLDGTHLSVRLGTGGDVSELVAALVAAGARVDEVQRSTSLEDAFLALVTESSLAARASPDREA